MKMNRITSNILFYMLVIIATLSIYRIDRTFTDVKVLLSNLLLIFLSMLFMIYGDPYNYSLNKIFFLFSFFFFGIAPAIQYQKGIVLWSRQFYTSRNYFQMNLLLLFILVVYQALYLLFSKTKSSLMERKIVRLNNRERKISNWGLLFVTFFSLVVSLFVYQFSLANLLVRGGVTIFEDSSISLIYFNFIRPIPAIALFFFKKKKNNNRYVETILWLILLVTNFPLAAARFYIAALYIPIFLIYVKQMEDRYLFLNQVLIIGLLIVFPFLDQVRRMTDLSELSLKTIDFKMFLEGHFDSYQMFMHVVVYRTVTYGKQLLTALLFFVPRSLWPQKSVGSGSYVAEKYHFIFDNISMNYFGEGYINFGYVGIFLFVVILAYFNARYDKFFWTRIKTGTPLDIYYLQSLGLQFFLLRGDLLSGIAFLTGIFVSTLVVYKIVSYPLERVPWYK